MIEIRCKKVTFYSKGDEEMFFNWAKNIKVTNKAFGELDDIVLPVESAIIDDDSLRELIALLHRYNLPLKQLAVFKNANNQAWFYDENKFWHDEVFASNG